MSVLTLMLALAPGRAILAAEQTLVDGPPTLPVPEGQPEIPLKRKTASIGVLVRAHDETGKEVGPPNYFIRVSATASAATKAPTISFNEFLGPQSLKALDAVLRSVVTLEQGWPGATSLQLSFTKRPSPAELVPATLGEVVLIDSMLRDWDIEPNLAIAGAFLPDGTVDSIGGIADRLQGAARANVGRVLVPAKNTREVSDFLLTQGISSFLGTQIFTVKNFNEAGLLSLAQLDADTKEAIRLFGAVQRTLQAAGGNAVPLLRDARVQGTLQQILGKAPNHLSAQILYDWGTGKKTQISLDGSMSAIDRFAPELVGAMRAPGDTAFKTPRASVERSVAGLKFVRDRLDARARPYADALLKFGDAMLLVIPATGSPPRRLGLPVRAGFDTTRQQVQDEWTKLAELRAKPAE